MVAASLIILAQLLVLSGQSVGGHVAGGFGVFAFIVTMGCVLDITPEGVVRTGFLWGVMYVGAFLGLGLVGAGVMLAPETIPYSESYWLGGVGVVSAAIGAMCSMVAVRRGSRAARASGQ